MTPEEERAARVEAFLTVPLYAAVYEKYRGHLLPPTKALEREMLSLGVAPKQTDKARQAFERSAREAGFFDSGEERLVKPRIDGATRRTSPDEAQTSELSTESEPLQTAVKGGAGVGSFHPFIEGLLKTLPESGEKWLVKDRVKWLRLAANAFDLIYESDSADEIEIKSKAAGD